MPDYTQSEYLRQTEAEEQSFTKHIQHPSPQEQLQNDIENLKTELDALNAKLKRGVND
jgi:uncharacterized FlaG/YvyC family protein